MTKSVTIPWCAFSQKHKDYIKKGLKCRMSVAEGSIRAGKTIDNCILFADAIERSNDKFHLASGSTLANAKMNIGVCNGFGLEFLFRGRCRWGKFKDNEALYIKTHNFEKIVLFVGGGKADSFKKILGYSIGCWCATEINQHYDSDDSETSFIKVAFGRQAAARNPITIWDMNPSAPTHKIYTEYIDKYKKLGLIGGYNYGHFTLDDNLSISKERKQEIMSMYDPDSLWYKRDILGMRVVSEGVIYRSFADKPLKRKLTKEQFDKYVKPNIIEIECGIDFGGNKSRNTFVATAFTRFYKDAIVVKSERLDEELDPDTLNKKFVIFCKEIYNKYSRGFNANFDNAEPVLARGLKNAAAVNGCACDVVPAFKNPVLQRIKLTLTLDAQCRLWYLEGECDTFVEAICGAVWDSKHPDTRLDDGTSDIDTMDAFEYSIEKKTTLLLEQNKSLIKELISNGN